MPNYLIVPGATRIETPDKFRKLVPEQYEVEAFELHDGTETKLYAIVKLRHVDVRLTDADFLLPDDQFKARIIDPMLMTFREREKINA